MALFKQLLGKYSKESKKEKVKRTQALVSPWMHDQVKQVLSLNQRIVTTK